MRDNIIKVTIYGQNDPFDLASAVEKHQKLLSALAAQDERDTPPVGMVYYESEGKVLVALLEIPLPTMAAQVSAVRSYVRAVQKQGVHTLAVLHSTPGVIIPTVPDEPEGQGCLMRAEIPDGAMLEWTGIYAEGPPRSITWKRVEVPGDKVYYSAAPVPAPAPVEEPPPA